MEAFITSQAPLLAAFDEQLPMCVRKGLSSAWVIGMVDLGALRTTPEGKDSQLG